MRASRFVLAAAMLSLAAGCNRDTTGPTHGWLRVSATTSGFDLDPDGYLFQLDGGAARPLDANGSVVVAGLTPGAHQLLLEGTWPNCVADGGASRSLTVVAGDTATVALAVSCAHRFGAIRIRATTAGQDLDRDGYTVRVDSRPMRALAPDDSVRIDSLFAGPHVVTLGGAATNCSPGDSTHSVTLVAGDTARTAFAVTCMPRLGSLTVTVATIGDLDLDPDGYTVQVDAAPPRAARIHDTLRYGDLTEGAHQVTLTGTADNCVASAGGHAAAQVSFESAATVAFAVTCAARLGTLVVSTRTTGPDADNDGFMLVVDSTYAEFVDVNGSSAHSLHEGDHVLSLAGVQPNCAVAGGTTRTVHVGWQRTDSVALDVTCTAFAVLHVVVTTTGSSPDRNGYGVSAALDQEGPTIQVTASGTATFGTLGTGTYQLRLSDVAANCAVAGSNPRSVTTVSGQVTEAAIEVVCAPPEPILYVSDQDGPTHLFVVGSDGAGVQRIIGGPDPVRDPAWSRGGAKIAYANIGLAAGIWTANADGSNPVRLTSGDSLTHDGFPTWSPDGSRLAFVRTHGGNADIAVVSGGGGQPTFLTSDAAADVDPAWSPDGTRLAFVSARDGNPEIYVMNADGSNVVRLTTNSAADIQPDWSPDGMRIAFARGDCASADSYYCSSTPMIMDANGANARALPLVAYLAADPSWSPDGRHLVLTMAACDYYGYCSPYLVTANVDGSDSQFLVDVDSWQPAWRR